MQGIGSYNHRPIVKCYNRRYQVKTDQVLYSFCAERMCPSSLLSIGRPFSLHSVMPQERASRKLIHRSIHRGILSEAHLLGDDAAAVGAGNAAGVVGAWALVDPDEAAAGCVLASNLNNTVSV